MPWEIPQIKNYSSVPLFEGTFKTAHILLLKDILGLNAEYLETCGAIHVSPNYKSYTPPFLPVTDKTYSQLIRSDA
jgi:hypothetical protein